MKNIILIFVLTLLSVGVKAKSDVKNVSYVKTGDEVYIGQDLKIGLFNYKVIDLNGAVTKVPIRNVVAYSHNSRIFEYLPVVCETNDTSCFAMMEYITSKSGLNLYRYSCPDGNEERYEYFVFKKGQFHLRIDQKNAKTTLPYFGIRVI